MGRYASVNGLDMYYEIHGAGSPLVLLHGALSTIDIDFGRILPPLAETREVIAIEQQAHGRTNDFHSPLSVRQMAADTAALLESIGVRQADFLGYSMGAGIALQVAVQYPALVRRLVVVGGTYDSEGFHPGVLAGIKALAGDEEADSMFQEAYSKTAPDPDNWPALIDKVKQLDRTMPTWSPVAIQSIRAPSLFITGESGVSRSDFVPNMVRLEDGDAVAEATDLTEAQVAMLPGITYVTLVQHAERLLPMIEAFLEEPVPELEPELV